MRLSHSGGRILDAEVRSGERIRNIKADAFISTLPLPELIARLEPAPPSRVFAAAAQLRFRDFLTVCLIIDTPSLFPDNWIYVHEPKVKVARIQNFKNWSPQMVPDQGKTSLGMEYFCSLNDPTWNLADEELVKLATDELVSIGLVGDRATVVDGCVFRVAGAYPIYDEGYAEAVHVIREYLETFENLRTAGRNGLHRYNNQDHSMLAGRLAARELLLSERADLWSLNTDEDYHEEKSALQVKRERLLDTASTGGTDLPA
jgi:protoporphyrinogen oxidase